MTPATPPPGFLPLASYHEYPTDEMARRRRLLAARHLLAFERDRASEDLREEMIEVETREGFARAVASRLVRLESGGYTDPADLLSETRPLGGVPRG